MHHTTGFTTVAIDDICATLQSTTPPAQNERGLRPALTLRERVIITLTYLRRNRTQLEIAEEHGVSQATISRIIKTWTTRILTAFVYHCPTVEDLDPEEPAIIDGTMLPCWSWRDRPELYSGKHKTTGVNVQVACSPEGRLLWVSDPLPGSTHDAKAIDTSGILDHLDPAQCIGDKGYIGRGMITPLRKNPTARMTNKHASKTPASTRSDTSSNALTPTSRNGRCSTLTTADPSTPSQKQSPPSSYWSSAEKHYE